MPRQRREDAGNGTLLGLGIGVAGLTIGGGAYLFWDRFLRSQEEPPPEPPDPEWNVGERVIFINRTINTVQRLGTITFRRLNNNTWRYDILEDEGQSHLSIPELDILASATAPEWDIGERVIFIARTINAINRHGVIVAVRFQGGEWFYDIAEDGGLGHTNIPEADIIGPSGPPGVAGGAAIWLFDEGSGTTAFDSTISEHDLTLTNHSWSADGLVFNQDGAIARRPLFMPSGGHEDMTIVAIARFNALNTTGSRRNPRICQAGERALGAENSPVAYQFGCDTYDNSRRMRFSVWMGDRQFDVRSNEIIQPNTWYHLVATRQSSVLRLFVNGLVDNSAACSNSRLKVVNGNFNVGESPGNSDGQFIGVMRELRLYHRALTPGEVNILWEIYH
jgi:hypothetical protein